MYNIPLDHDWESLHKKRFQETFLPVDQILNLVSNQNQAQNRVNNEISKLAQKMRPNTFSPDEMFSGDHQGTSRNGNFYENARDNSLFLSSEKKIRYPEEMNELFTKVRELRQTRLDQSVKISKLQTEDFFSKLLKSKINKDLEQNEEEDDKVEQEGAKAPSREMLSDDQNSSHGVDSQSEKSRRKQTESEGKSHISEKARNQDSQQVIEEMMMNASLQSDENEVEHVIEVEKKKNSADLSEKQKSAAASLSEKKKSVSEVSEKKKSVSEISEKKKSVSEVSENQKNPSDNLSEKKKNSADLSAKQKSVESLPEKKKSADLPVEQQNKEDSKQKSDNKIKEDPSSIQKNQEEIQQASSSDVKKKKSIENNESPQPTSQKSTMNEKKSTNSTKEPQEQKKNKAVESEKQVENQKTLSSLAQSEKKIPVKTNLMDEEEDEIVYRSISYSKKSKDFGMTLYQNLESSVRNNSKRNVSGQKDQEEVAEQGGDFNDLMKIVTMGLSKENIKTFLENAQKSLTKPKEKTVSKVKKDEKEKQKTKTRQEDEEETPIEKKKIASGSKKLNQDEVMKEEELQNPPEQEGENDDDGKDPEQEEEATDEIVKIIKWIEQIKKVKLGYDKLTASPALDNLNVNLDMKLEDYLTKLLYIISDDTQKEKTLKENIDVLVLNAHRLERKWYGPYRKNDLLVFALKEYKALKDEKLRHRILIQEGQKALIAKYESERLAQTKRSESPGSFPEQIDHQPRMNEKYFSNTSQSQNLKYHSQTARSNYKTSAAPPSKNLNQSHVATQKKGKIPKHEPQESDWIGCEDNADFNSGWVSMPKK